MQTTNSHTVPLAQYEELLEKYNDAIGQLEWFKRQLLGVKSERFVPQTPEQLNLGLDGEKQEQIAEEVSKIVAEHTRKTPDKEKKNHPGRQQIPAHLPRKTETILPPGDLTGLKQIGEDVTEILEFEKGRAWVRRIVRPKFAPIEAIPGQEEGQIIQAEIPQRPFARMKAGASLIAFLLLAKYVDHLPLYRINKQFQRLGLKVPDTTMSQWVAAGAEKLEVLYTAYKKILLASNYLQMDETTLDVLQDGKGKCHQGYIWAMYDPIRQLPFFFYQKGRDHKGPKDLLQHHQGYLQSDGYSVYELLNKYLPDITLVNCLAHIRRKFFEAIGNDEVRANTVLIMIAAIYDVERQARHQQLNAEQRLELRLTQSKSVFDTLYEYLILEQNKVLPASAIGKAIAYALKRWQNMKPLFIDGHLEVDNNLVENIIRPTAIGRKNYLFAGSHEAAQRSAVIYTFFAACKHHKINPEKWLEDVFNRIDAHPINRIEELMPHKWVPPPEKKRKDDENTS